MTCHISVLRRLTPALLLLLALTVFLGSCHSGGTAGEQSSGMFTSAGEPEQNGESQTSDLLTIVRDGSAARIVYSLEAEGVVIERANSLAQSIEKMTGIRPTVGDDWLRKGETHDAATVEILIGRTNYTESESVYRTLGYGEGAVAAVGNKIVVAGTDDSSLSSAVTKLLAALSQYRQEDILSLPADLSVYVSANELLAALPILEDASPNIIDAGDNCWELVFAQADAADFQIYAGLLEQNGYVLYTENRIEENAFQTRTDGTNVVSVTYTPALQKLFVFIEPLSMTALPDKAGETVPYTEAVTTMVTQIGLYRSGNFNGMCYVMRLADGSFLIIDGGHGGSGDAMRIYETMRKQAPDPDHIVVAAWIFTHAHGDHVGVFPSFTSQYASLVTVERFIFNFPNDTQAAAGGGDNRSQVTSALRNENYQDAERIKAHAGQVFSVRNAEIEMLCGLELLEPHNLTYYNNCSLVFTVKADGKQMLILGDCGEREDSILGRLYTADTLRSDILQIAHHGINGCGTALYATVSPDYAFWPVGSLQIESMKLDLSKLSINEWFFDPENISPDRVFVAGATVVILEIREDGIVSTVYDTAEAYLSQNG